MVDQASNNINEITPQMAASMLQFYAEAGVVDLLEDEPIDRYADTIKKLEERKSKNATRMNASIAANKETAQNTPSRGGNTAQNRPAPSTPQSNALPVPDQAAMDETRAMAKSANSIEELQKLVTAYKGCNLCHSAKNTVFADGNPQAPIMFIGEAPGRDEDVNGTPFVGPLGQLMDKMLAAISLDRTSCYLTNILPWRPPGNRTPVAHEIELCRPFVERHIELAAPKMLVVMGSVSTKTLLKTNKGILSLRGNWGTYQIGDNAIPTMPTLHPAYLIKTPAAKRNVWMDLLAIQAKRKEMNI